MILGRQKDANDRGMIVHQDADDFGIEAIHNVGLSLHMVDVATGELVLVGYRHLVMSQLYNEDSPQAVSNFSAVQRLCSAVTSDILAAPKNKKPQKQEGK